MEGEGRSSGWRELCILSSVQFLVATAFAPMREEIVKIRENGCKVCAHHFGHLEAR